MRGHVYLIDDDAIVRDSLGLLLGLLPDLSFRSFDSGSAWLAEAGAVPPGVVLLDHQMPGITGIDTLAAYSARHRDLPTLLMTGTSDPALDLRAKAAGAMEVLVKPVPPDVLLAAVGRALAAIRA